jgi:hypothetical protein
MKRDKEFDNILEECLERILTGGETIEQCLSSYPEQATELEPLLQMALSTRETLAIKPRPEFRDRARYQMQAALREMAEEQQRRFSFFGWQPRWATAVIAVLILVLASGSTVAAASGSMPDEPLYPVKLAAERVQLALTPSALGKAQLYAKLADKRVAEIVKMADRGKAKQVERTAQRLNEQLVVMASLVSPEEREAVFITPTPEAVQAPSLPAAVEGPRQERHGMVTAPVPPTAEAPAEEKAEVQIAPAQPVPRKAPELQRAPQAVPPERAETDVEGVKLDRRAKLRMVVAKNAVKHPAVLRELLEKVPESAKPALLRAIAASDVEYEKILEILGEEYEEDENENEDKDEDKD